ncbi:unnamed protein product [Durusdinium trenchii]|uniref:Ankyrin repeat protein n=1 Tax=Durusdinium trenchii TaxID=1381693 RepID=A0ABP0HY62_9DINO
MAVPGFSTIPAGEQLAEVLAQDASTANTELLSSGDPVKVVLRHLEMAEHRHILQAAVVLFQRLCESEPLPELQKLVSLVREVLLPTLMMFESHLSTRRAFQAASTLTPLLNRAATLAAQSCSLAIRGPWSPNVLHPFCEAVSDLAEVFSGAIIARAELRRPFDAPRIYSSHRRFAELAAAIGKAVASSPASWEIQRKLANLPERPEHCWRYDQLRHFWNSSCSEKYGDAVPIDELAILLLQAAGADVSLANREALMRRMHTDSRRISGKVCADELDAFSAEIRRSGGLKAWVHGVAFGGDLGGDWMGPCRPRLGRAAFPTTKRWDHSSRALRPATLQKQTEGCLVDAVAQGLLKASQRLVLGQKASPNARDAHGDTALHLAASLDFKHGSLAALLLKNGADINAQDRHLGTPLHNAVAGQSNLAKELVENGADIGREDRWKRTPLHTAAEHGKAELATLLLHEGAGITANDWGATPLHRAVARGQLAVVEALLVNGADANAEAATSSSDH